MSDWSGWVRWAIRVVISLISAPLFLLAILPLEVCTWAFYEDPVRPFELVGYWAEGFRFPERRTKP